MALDLSPTQGTSEELAAALNPLLVAELAKREGMSVISQADVRALLELEADRSALGCDEASCMADIAGSLGAELLATSTVSKVGRDIVVAITLIQVEGAKVIRRGTARARGESEAPTAVVSAVHELFRSGLPRELQGPASMSRRGFRAALAGLRNAVLDPKVDPKVSRKRVILDLVNTELDYDAKPKLQMLDNEVREAFSDIRTRILGARSTREQKHLHRALETWAAINDDLGRVKEIRERARERGIVPSAQPLRFENPEPFDVPDEAEWNRHWKSTRHARKVVEKACAALKRGDEKAFVSLFTKERQKKSAAREFQSRRAQAERDGVTWTVMPSWAHSQRHMMSAVEKRDDGKISVYVVQLKKGQPQTWRQVRLMKEEGQWRVDYW